MVEPTEPLPNQVQANIRRLMQDHLELGLPQWFEIDASPHVTDENRFEYWQTSPETTFTRVQNWDQYTDDLQTFPVELTPEVIRDMEQARPTVHAQLWRKITAATSWNNFMDSPAFNTQVLKLEDMCLKILTRLCYQDDPSQELFQIQRECEDLDQHMLYVLTSNEFWSFLPQCSLTRQFAQIQDGVTQCAAVLFQMGQEYSRDFYTNNLKIFFKEFLTMKKVYLRVNSPSDLLLAYTRSRYRGGNGCGQSSIFTWLCMAITRDLRGCSIYNGDDLRPYDEVQSNRQVSTAVYRDGTKIARGLNLVHLMFYKMSRSTQRNNVAQHFNFDSDPSEHLTTLLTQICNHRGGFRIALHDLKASAFMFEGTPNYNLPRNVILRSIDAAQHRDPLRILIFDAYFWKVDVRDDGTVMNQILTGDHRPFNFNQPNMQ